ncbi:MAG: signal peptidase II [Pseudomonadales bacterium]|nr:signal peptidase II [Pseudomonadales bacterium]
MSNNTIKQPALWVLFITIAVIIGLDQWTKALATDLLQYGRPIYVMPVLNWTLLHNYGAAFSFLSDQGGWQRWFFMIISAVVSCAFVVWLVRLPKEQWIVRFSLTLIIAGAVGNLIDRVSMGYVVDFIHFHWQDKYFPAFNIADMAITGGAGFMLLDMFFGPDASDKTEADEQAVKAGK